MGSMTKQHNFVGGLVFEHYFSAFILVVNDFYFSNPQPSSYDSSSATFTTHCRAVDCKQEEGCYQKADLLNQPCSLPNSLIKNTQLLSYRLNDVIMKEDEDCEEEEELPLNLTISSARNLNQKDIQNSPSSRQRIGRTVEGHSNVCSFNTGRPVTQGTSNVLSCID